MWWLAPGRILDWSTGSESAYSIYGGVILCDTEVGSLWVVVVLFAQFTKRDPTRVGQIPYGQNQIDQTKLNSKVEGLSLREAVCTLQFLAVFVQFSVMDIVCMLIMVHIVPHATELGISAIRAASILATIGGWAFSERFC